MSDCLFCKIIAGDIPSKKVYEDETCYAFYDIDPQAPVHFLIIPKMHIEGADTLTEETAAVVSHIFLAVRRIAEELGLENGYRMVTNVGQDGGQTVRHLHFHVLAKRSLAWPPG